LRRESGGYNHRRISQKDTSRGKRVDQEREKPNHHLNLSPKERLVSELLLYRNRRPFKKIAPAEQKKAKNKKSKNERVYTLPWM
jgi:hypothetical protein